MAWTVAPRNESNNEPSRPAAATATPTRQEAGYGAIHTASTPISAAPASAARVPVSETAPEVPFSTSLPGFVSIRGGCGFKTPSSVVQVSALTAARLPAKPTHTQAASG